MNIIVTLKLILYAKGETAGIDPSTGLQTCKGLVVRV